MLPQMNLNAADLAATNVRVRYSKIKRRKMCCLYCERTVMCSIRLKACVICYMAEKLQLKWEEEDFDFDDQF